MRYFFQKPKNGNTRLSLCVLAFLISFWPGPLSGDDGASTISVIKDGKSWYFDEIVELVSRELASLSEGKYTVEIRDDLDADYSASHVRQKLENALADPTVDVIYAAGTMATEMASSLDESVISKPVLGGALQLSETRGYPISQQGTSTLKNYTFITNPRRVSVDIDLLKQLSGAEKIHVLVDDFLIPELRNLEVGRTMISESLGVKIEILPARIAAEATLAEVPDDVSAMYVTTLVRLSEDERRLLYAGLADRQIITVAMSGEIGVRLGALGGLASSNSQAVARRTALNIHELLLGGSTELLPVYLPLQDRLILNSETAQRTGWSPDYDTALAAEFVGQEFRFEGEAIALEQALETAIENNVDVTIAREDKDISQYDTKIARSRLLPQLNLIGNYARSHVSDRINPLTTPDYAHQETLGVQLRQILFNDEVWSGLKAQRKIEEAEDYDQLSTELDVLESVSIAYFDYLSAKKLYDIERENLSLTENNYQLAQLRADIGSVEPSEVYRWEQNRASGRAALIQRESARSNALIRFNRLIGAPREAVWNFEDINVRNDELFFMDEFLNTKIQRAVEFRQWGVFLQKFALDNAPELVAFDLQLAAQGYFLRQKQRRYYLPEVSASVEYAYVQTGSEFAQTDSQNEATLGVQLTFPLFEGGLRDAEIRQRKATIRRLSAQREKALQQIEERVMVAFNAIASGHPNIRLSRRALVSAEKNYNSVQEKYSQGAASILDLLDAQSALLSQRQAAAVAVYDYLAAVHQLQRSIAWFEFKKTESEKREWIDLYEDFLNSNQ